MLSQTGPVSLVDSRRLWNTILIHYNSPPFLPTHTLFLMAEVKLYHQKPEICSFTSLKVQCTSHQLVQVHMKSSQTLTGNAHSTDEIKGCQGQQSSWGGGSSRWGSSLQPLFLPTSTITLVPQHNLFVCCLDVAKLCSSSFSQCFQGGSRGLKAVKPEGGHNLWQPKQQLPQPFMSWLFRLQRGNVS